jgi:hypothetical protein
VPTQKVVSKPNFGVGSSSAAASKPSFTMGAKKAPSGFGTKPMFSLKKKPQ